MESHTKTKTLKKKKLKITQMVLDYVGKEPVKDFVYSVKC